jgi:DNA polymerase IV
MSTRYNEQFIQVLGQMAMTTSSKGEHFKTKAYKKAQETIMNMSSNITCIEDIEGLPGIGKSILEKLGQAMNQTNVNKESNLEEDPMTILCGVYGIGPKKASELVESGIKTISQLRKVQNEVLNDKQIIGLKYYEDVLKRVPREEIDQYDKILKKLLQTTYSKFAQVEEDVKYEIVGSYRRGALDSGDIDIIIKSKNPEIFVLWIDNLIKNKVILEVLSRGPSKCLVMAKIPSSSFVRRVDFLYCPPEEFAFSILYFTGSKEFNTVMRSRALEFGLTLNEHGFHHMIQGEKGKKVKGPKLIQEFKDEKDIFNHLKIEWKEPHERKDGSCVIKI